MYFFSKYFTSNLGKPIENFDFWSTWLEIFLDYHFSNASARFWNTNFQLEAKLFKSIYLKKGQLIAQLFFTHNKTHQFKRITSINFQSCIPKSSIFQINQIKIEKEISTNFIHLSCSRTERRKGKLNLWHFFLFLCRQSLYYR